MAAEGSSPKIDAVPDVDIDAGGRFKYILIRIVDTSCGASKHIVRGYDWAAYHGKRIVFACVVRFLQQEIGEVLPL